MILVTGATGTIGSGVTRRLADGGVAVRAMTRDPSRARTPPGVEVVPGDLDQPESLRAALVGVTTVFLATAPGPSVSRHDLAMLDVARSADVRKVVKLSAIGTGTADDVTDATGESWHSPGERALRASGLAWTLLRPTVFASNTLSWADAIRAGQPVPNMTAAGALGVIDPRDVAEIATLALTSGTHDGQIYTLTGPELLTAPDQAALLGKVLGRAVDTADVDLDTAREGMLASGLDAATVDMFVTGLGRVRAGRAAVLTDDVAAVLGRPPRAFEAWARDHRDRFA
jgi:uncharacterized protein YbjT (DUF2867 family)